MKVNSVICDVMSNVDIYIEKMQFELYIVHVYIFLVKTEILYLNV